MLRRLQTSLSNPKAVVFFMKDRFSRVIGYALLLPLLLLIPLMIQRWADPSMDINRYQLMVQEIEKNFQLDQTEIVDGKLITSEQTSATFEYFTIYLGTQDISPMTINVVFESDSLALYMGTIEQERMSYQSLDLMNFDFSNPSTTDFFQLSTAVKTIIDTYPLTYVVDLTMIYFIGVTDYFVIGLLLAMMMFIFPIQIPLPFSYRYKISLYLMTVYVVSQLILSLFKLTEFGFISILVVYIYHVIAYRFMRHLRVEVIDEKRQI
ncbi:MAG: DUF1189 family protein [Acholeplasmataceae bacterium]|nr:DUF1189 family protein [Acholeplasmataceae bacterium]